MNERRPILLAFDGSPGARAAIERAGELLGPRSAVVFTAWQPVSLAVPATTAPPYFPDIDPAYERHAQATVGEGVALAEATGFAAEPVVSREPLGYWTAILEAAEDVDASLIVVGARGLSPLKSVLLGSVSNGVVHHSKRPVLVVHGAD